MIDKEEPKQQIKTNQIRISRLKYGGESDDFVAENESDKVSNKSEKEDLNIQF